MKGITEFIIEFDTTHFDTIKKGQTEYAVNPFFEQNEHINRIGKVVNTPYVYDGPIKKGDEVMIIHTSLIQETYKKGREQSSFCVNEEKNWFRFDPNLIVLYRENNNKDWKAHLKNVMVLPISLAKEIKQWNGYEIPDGVFENEQGYKGNEKQTGVVAYDNDSLNENGIFKGDTVVFKFDREYEFLIDGKIHYHMENCDLILHKNNFIKTEATLEDAFI